MDPEFKQLLTYFPKKENGVKIDLKKKYSMYEVPKEE
jgi:hypothetical protein